MKSTNKVALRKNIALDERGKIKVSASPTSSKHDFDFLQGNFRVHHKKLKSRLSHSDEWFEFDGSMHNRAVLTGIGNVENHTMITLEGKPVEGFALRLFDPQTRLWSIYWADSQTGILDLSVVGSFDGDKGYFFANDHFNGQEILLQFEWDVTDPRRPVWRQGFSVDQGNTWEWNWYMYFTNADQDVYQELVKNEQQMMDAISVGDTAIWLNFLHEDCLIAVEDGKTLSRNELVSSMKPLPAGYNGRIVVIEPTYHRYDDTFVLSFIDDEYLELFGQKIHTQYRQTDTWKNFDGEWKMVAMQLFEIPKNPPSVSLPESVLTRYMGTYALSSDRKCTIIVEGGKLYAEKTGREKEELLPETENIFFRKNDGRVRVIFIKDSETAYHLIERRAGEDLVWKREASESGFTMTKNIDNQTQSELKKLEPLVGVWETKGWTRESSSAPAAEIIATDTYEWLVNGFVLLHRVDARVGSEKVNGAELIGYHPSQPAYQTQYFGSDGPNAYEAKMIEEAGGLMWKMQSEKDRFTGVFSENRDLITGHWELLDDEGRWQPWMDVTLTRVKN